MARVQTRRNVSVSAAFMRVIEDGAARRGLARSRLVELACADLSGVDVERVRDGMDAARTRRGR